CRDRRSWRRNRQVIRLIPDQLAERDAHVSREAALLEAVRGERVRDARIKSDPRDVEEEPVVDLTGVDGAFLTVERELQRGGRVEWNAEIARQAVARPTRHKRHARA